MKKKPSQPYAAHHRAVQQHFACKPTAYQTVATVNVPGLGIEYGGRYFRVETLLDRTAICVGQLSELDGAGVVPLELAEELLEHMETRPGFFVTLLNVLTDDKTPGRGLEAKINLSLGLSIAQVSEQPLWGTLAEVEEELVAAALVATGRLEAMPALALELAELYFQHGKQYLCELQGGVFVLLPDEQDPVAIYEVSSPY